MLNAKPIVDTTRSHLGLGVNAGVATPPVYVPAEKLTEETRKLAKTIIANAPLGVKAGRQLTYLATEMGRSAAFPLGDLAFERLYRSEDALEGPRAFREKRKPNWKGR